MIMELLEWADGPETKQFFSVIASILRSGTTWHWKIEQGNEFEPFLTLTCMHADF